MKNVKRLGAAMALTCVLGLSAFGQMCVPGQASTWPCAAAQPIPGDPAAPGQLETPPATNAVDVLSVAEAAMNLLLTF